MILGALVGALILVSMLLWSPTRGRSPAVLRSGATEQPEGRRAWSRVGSPVWRLGPAPSLVLVGALALGSQLLPGRWAPGPGVVVAGAALGGTWLLLVRARVGRRRAQRRQQQVDEALALLVSDLRAGARPGDALVEAAECAPKAFAAAARVAQRGADPAAALVAASRIPGHALLAGLAARWSVCSRCGASLSGAVSALVAERAAGAAVERQVAEELAPVRTTAHVLLVLPAAGVALAGMLGLDPVSVYLTGVVGQWCLAAAAVLAALGALWVERLTTSAAGPRTTRQ